MIINQKVEQIEVENQEVHLWLVITTQIISINKHKYFKINYQID